MNTFVTCIFWTYLGFSILHALCIATRDYPHPCKPTTLGADLVSLLYMMMLTVWSGVLLASGAR